MTCKSIKCVCGKVGVGAVFFEENVKRNPRGSRKDIVLGN